MLQSNASVKLLDIDGHIGLAFEVFDDFPGIRSDCCTCVISDSDDILLREYGDAENINDILVANVDLVGLAFRENTQHFYTSCYYRYGLRTEPQFESEIINRLVQLMAERLAVPKTKSARNS